MLNLARSWAATAISRSRAATPASSSARLLLGQAGSGRGISAGTCCATNVGSHMSDNDPQALQHHKEQSLKGETPAFIEDVPGWNQTVASVSEAVVKAERYVDCDTMVNPAKLEELQRHTITVVQQLHHTGEEGMPAMPKNHEQDVSASPAHAANLEHTRKNDTGSDPR